MAWHGRAVPARYSTATRDQKLFIYDQITSGDQNQFCAPLPSYIRRGLLPVRWLWACPCVPVRTDATGRELRRHRTPTVIPSDMREGPRRQSYTRSMCRSDGGCGRRSRHRFYTLLVIAIGTVRQQASAAALRSINHDINKYPAQEAQLEPLDKRR